MKKGLKNHEIAQLVNTISKEVSKVCTIGCLREIISKSTNKYLISKGLAIDQTHSGETK